MIYFSTNKAFKIMRLLEGLRINPYASQYELAGKVGIVPGLVNRYIKEQEEIQRLKVISENQRVKSYHLTEEGLRALWSMKCAYYNEIIDMNLESAEEVRRYLREAAVPTEIVLFGANPIAAIICGMVEYEVLYLLDNNSAFHGKKWLGRDVYPVQAEYLSGKTIIICSCAHSREMAEQLNSIREKNPDVSFRYIQLI